MFLKTETHLPAGVVVNRVGRLLSVDIPGHGCIEGTAGRVLSEVRRLRRAGALEALRSLDKKEGR